MRFAYLAVLHVFGWLALLARSDRARAYSVFHFRSGSAEALVRIRRYACEKPAMVFWSNAPELNSMRHFSSPEGNRCMLQTAPPAS